jgi:hypothetical protein
MASLHNLSRSLGCAIMLAANTNLFTMILGGEYALHFLVKVLRDDFLAFIRNEGLLGVFVSLAHHLMVKLVLGERAKRENLVKTRAMNPAKWLQTATFTTKN